MNTTVAPERTGWRDERISNRHRAWGWDCPALDIDFLMLEYNHGLPSVLVEFKHGSRSRLFREKNVMRLHVSKSRDAAHLEESVGNRLGGERA